MIYRIATVIQLMSLVVAVLVIIKLVFDDEGRVWGIVFVVALLAVPVVLAHLVERSGKDTPHPPGHPAVRITLGVLFVTLVVSAVIVAGILLVIYKVLMELSKV